MSYVTGKTIKELREKRKMTQKELAEKISVSDKTVSKWETEKGLPDVAIVEDLAKALGTSITELLTGVYPICGNIITAVGQGAFSCCGVNLPKPEPEKCDGDHLICLEVVKLYPEQEISVRFRKKGHGMIYVYCNRHGMFQKMI